MRKLPRAEERNSSTLAPSAWLTRGRDSWHSEIKHMLTETSPLLLITTVLVTVLHMLCADSLMFFLQTIERAQLRIPRLQLRCRSLAQQKGVRAFSLATTGRSNEIGQDDGRLGSNNPVQHLRSTHHPPLSRRQVRLSRHSYASCTRQIAQLGPDVIRCAFQSRLWAAHRGLEGSSCYSRLVVKAGIEIQITKAVDISIQPNPTGIIPYRIDVKDKHVLNEDEKKTQECVPSFLDSVARLDDVSRYDKLAFRWVSMVMVPFLIGYTIYSLLYNEHRGWCAFASCRIEGYL